MAFGDKDRVIDVDSEVLFESGVTENLEYQEPAFPAEESGNDGLEVYEEKLFSSGGFESSIESLSSTIDSNGEEYFIQEESLTFKEPVRPEFISEEVLFQSVPEESVSEDVSGAPSILSDELSAFGEMQVKNFVLGAKISGEDRYVEKNFAKKLLEADYEIIKRYEELKNYILEYKDVKSRVSNDFDSFNVGRTQLFKLGYSTKSLKLYVNLDINEVESRLKCKDVSNKKAYAKVPVFLRIKSPRAQKNAKHLIDQVAVKFSLVKSSKITRVDAVKILKSKAKSY